MWLLEAITTDVHALNAEFSEPLPASEADGIARSIHRWITTRSRMWKDGAVAYEATLVAHASSTADAKAVKFDAKQASRAGYSIEPTIGVRALSAQRPNS